jgi:hypothetical protein
MRVLFRVGLAETTSPEAAIAAARKVHPECPGELDAALWKIRAGRDTLSLFFSALNF